MNSQFTEVPKTDLNLSFIVLVTVSLLFLQHGFTYYASFQILATITILLLIFFNFKNFTTDFLFILSFFLFFIFLFLKAIDYPFVLKRDYTNIYITLIVTTIYASIIGFMSFFRFKNPISLLHSFMIISKATLLLLFSSFIISELNIFSFFNRATLYEQNAYLIDNFTNVEDILNLKNHSLMNFAEHARIDLFYGEPSFLAIVIFTCFGSFFICKKSLEVLNKEDWDHFKLDKETLFFFLLALVVLLYIRSFSAIMYGIAAFYYIIVKSKNIWKNFRYIFPLFLFLTIFIFSSLPYLTHRLDFANSLSFYQRFNFFLEYGLSEYFFGIQNSELISNGLHYIIATSGFGGILYLISVIRALVNYSSSIIPAGFIVVLFISIVMQNGAVFSPSKIVLFSLVLIPVSCCKQVALMIGKGFNEK